MRCWIAPRDITPGTEWGEAIINGIDHSQVMVLIFSENANESPQVRREVERAIGKTIPVLPLRIEDIRPKGAMEFALSNTHWLDAFTPPAADRLQQLADSVEALLGVKKPPTSNSTQTATTTGRKRGAWIVGSILGMIAIIASLAFFTRGGGGTAHGTGSNGPGSTGPSSTGPSSTVNKPADAKTSLNHVIDETMLYQGLWLVVEESLPAGPVRPGKLKTRNITLAIRDHNLVQRRGASPNEEETMSGSINLESTDGQRVFTVRGTSSEGTQQVWHGTYEFKDDHLHLCYRTVEGNSSKPVRGRDMPLAPQKMSYKGEDATYYLKLEKQRVLNRRQ